jgi:hypothetical protein
MSQGMTSQISPKSSSSPPRKKCAIADTHVVPHLGYVTTKTSLALTSKARPWRIAFVECMRALRASSIAMARASALRARRRRQARAASAAAAAAAAAAVAVLRSAGMLAHTFQPLAHTFQPLASRSQADLRQALREF